MKKLKGFLLLMRPANIVTSVTDVLAGVAVSSYFSHLDLSGESLFQILLLCISTAGLYGGGVVFNDLFDVSLDKVERPERPLPQGTVSMREALLLGVLLLLTGVVCAFWVSEVSGFIAVAIAAFALIYNKWSKHHSLLGPLNMGLCRGLNLLLGIGIVVPALMHWWWIGFVPIVYIAAVTMVSRGEVHGGNKKALYFAAVLFALVFAAIFVLSLVQGSTLRSLLFLILFAGMVYPALIKAIRSPLPANIGKAVKAGILALIMMNAAWAATFDSLVLAFIIVLLLPVSLRLAKIFAVT